MIGQARRGPLQDAVDLRLLCCNVRKVRPLTKHLHASTRGSPASAATSGRAARTSARSRSTTTTARS